MAPPRTDMAARFWSKVEKTDGCWLWPAESLDRDGYGSFHTDKRTRRRAHRVAYELVKGPIGEGLVLDHLCRNRRCVNPGHLEPTDNRTNVLRGIAPPARNAVATRCVHGHELTAENLYVYDGKRKCKPCIFQRQRDRRARLKQEAAHGG